MTMPNDVRALLPSVTPVDLKQLSRLQKIELLREYKVSGARSPNVVCFLATDLLASGPGAMPPGELYDLYEQVVVASLECGKSETARNYLNLLERRFGKKSTRVSHLRGLCWEAEGRTIEAKKLYEQLLVDEPTDEFVVKRLAAMLKGEGRYEDAIRVLQDDEVYTDEDDVKHPYFHVHRGNAMATYQELSTLYYLIGNIQRSIFYAEERLLFDPDLYFAHTRLAELYYMKKDYHRSTVEYAQSLRLNHEPNNSRAAYGLWQVANEVLKQHQSGGQRLKEETELQRVQDLREYACDILHTMYVGSPLLPALEAVLQRQAQSQLP